jgi:hypothetical protein
VAELEKTIRKKLADVPDVGRMVGTFVSTDGIRGVVDVGGGRIPADMAGYIPDINETVWVLFLNGTALILGPSVPKAGKGTIVGPPSGNLVQVDTVVGRLTIPYANGLTLSAGQVVKLGAANDGYFVYAIMSTSPAAPTPPPAPGGGGGTQTQIFMPTDAGSYGSRWWTNQVYSSDSNIGAWFYGSQIADTIPDGATIQSIEINISIYSLSYQAPNFGVHGSASKPGGAVGLSLVTGVSIASGFIGLPTSFGDYLKANVGGVGINHGGYAILNSLASDPASGALRIRWS